MRTARIARPVGTLLLLGSVPGCSENNELDPGTFTARLSGARTEELSGSAVAGVGLNKVLIGAPGDNSAGNALIKKMNPEMTDDLLAFSVGKMKEYGIVDSGDTVKDGIGAMSDVRMASFFDKMVKAGVVKGDVDYRKGYTLRFVNKGVGVNLRPKN